MLATTAAALLLGACARDEPSVSTASSGSGRGATIAQSAGCTSCHGGSFQGAVGPGWVGLAGSDVELADGSVVTADDAYLFESIRDPAAKTVAGFSVQMPRNSLSDDEIREIVAFIQSLAN